MSATDRQTTGAVHITELGINIQPAIDSLNELKSQIENFSAQMQQEPISIPIGGEGESSISQKFEDIDRSAKQFFSTQKQIETLNTSWRNFVSQIERVGVTTPQFDALKTRVLESANSMKKLTENTRNSNTISAEQVQLFKMLAIALQQYKGEFADLKNPISQFQALSKEIENIIKELDKMDGKTVKTSTKSEIANLRAEYQKLADDIKSGSISMEKAKQRAATLGESFTTLGQRINQGDGFLNNFITRLGNRVAWMVSMRMVNLITQAFNNFISTIKETEDAVIEVQRVLGDTSVTNEEVARTLNEIAYEYGQTFENVQDAFVKFVQTGMDFQNATDAVRATMLALNTAELDVSEATTGLIAVISQFGYEGSDLEAIIDKINITADNFAVTSEKIVSALQRAGGTAKAFGMSLDETIAVITALSEATGRAGANIGTALNSLILFSQKGEAIQKFSEFLGRDVSDMPVLELWGELSEKIQGNEEELAKWMAQSDAASELFTEDIAEVIGATDDYAAALEAADKGVFSAVGTYRQNYFIALLENFDRVIEVLEKMNESAGYSISENEKAMERLTAKMNQLTVAARELAVQFGEAGFLDLLKFLTDAGVSVLRLTKDLGGLRTVLTFLLSLLIAIKGTQIAKFLNSFLGPIKTIALALAGNAQAIADVRASISLAKEAITGFVSTGAGMVSILGFITTGIMAVVSAYNSWQEKQHQIRQEQINNALQRQADEAQKTYNEWQKLNQEYERTGIVTDELKSKSDALLEVLKQNGYVADDAAESYKVLAENAEEAGDELERIMTLKYGKASGDAKAAGQELMYQLKGAIKEARNMAATSGIMGIPIPVDITTQDGQDVLSYLDDLDVRIENIGSHGYGAKVATINIDVKSAEEAETALKNIDAAMKKIIEEGYEGDVKAATLDPTYQVLLNIALATEEAWNNYKTLTQQVKDYGDALDEINDSQGNAEDGLLNLDDELTKISDKMESITEKISDFNSAWDSLVSVVDDYNESGQMTSDMLEKLLELEPQYLSLLEEKNGKLYLNEQGTQALINSNQVYIQQLAALEAAKRIDALATDLQAASEAGLTLEKYKAQVATEITNGELYEAILNMIQGKGSAKEFATALNNVAKSAGLSGSYLSYFNTQARDFANLYGRLANMSATYKAPSYKIPSTVGGSGSGSSSADNAAKKALQAEIKAWQQRESDVKDYYKTLKEQTSDYYDDLIAQLEDVEEANDRINKQLDYYNSRQEIVTNLEQVRARSGVENREKEVEYQQKLIELDDDWRKTTEEWDIEDRIDQLKEMKETAVAQIEDALDEATKAIEATIETLQAKVDAMATSTGKSVASGISSGFTTGAGYGAEIFDGLFDNMEKRAEDFTKFPEQMLEDVFQSQQKITDEMKEMIVNQMPKNAQEGARRMLTMYQNNFTIPLKSEIDRLFNQIPSKLTSVPSYLPKTSQDFLYQNRFGGVGGTTSNTTNNNFSMFANINGTASANAASQILSGTMLRGSSKFR